jgi:hypothetical protein
VKEELPPRLTNALDGPALSLSGNLEDVSVADALQFIHLGGRTGTLTLVQGEVTAEIGFHGGRIVNAWGSMVENRRDLVAGGPRTSHAQHADLARLRRIVGDLRSGLISTTISLSLMNIISESVERAMLFLVRRDGLVALGAFGAASNGAPLAQISRGLKLPLTAGAGGGAGGARLRERAAAPAGRAEELASPQG